MEQCIFNSQDKKFLASLITLLLQPSNGTVYFNSSDKKFLARFNTLLQPSNRTEYL